MLLSNDLREIHDEKEPRPHLRHGSDVSAGFVLEELRRWPELRRRDLEHLASAIDKEADDALATGAARYAPEVGQVRILTPDKDLGQCVQGTRIVQVDRIRRKLIDEEVVRAVRGVAPASRNKVCSGEWVLRVKVSWNPLGSPAATVTDTSVSASSTTCGTGMGITGPIIKVRYKPLSMIVFTRPAGREPLPAA